MDEAVKNKRCKLLCLQRLSFYNQLVALFVLLGDC